MDQLSVIDEYNFLNHGIRLSTTLYFQIQKIINIEKENNGCPLLQY